MYTPALPLFLDILTLKDGTNMLPQNADKKVPISTVKHTRKAKTSK
jgi:hypothetical protein